MLSDNAGWFYARFCASIGVCHRPIVKVAEHNENGSRGGSDGTLLLLDTHRLGDFLARVLLLLKLVFLAVDGGDRSSNGEPSFQPCR